MMQIKEWGAFAYLSVVWGASFLLIKVAVQELGPVTLVAVRLGLATLGLWMIVLVGRVKVPRDPITLAQLAFLGLINTALPFGLIAWGEQYIDSGVASILNSGTPLFTLILAHFALDDEPFTWFKLTGLLVGFGGVVLIFSRGLGALNSTPLVLAGQAAVLGAAACYAVGVVFTRRYLRDVHPIVTAAVPITSAFLIMAVGSPILEAPVTLAMSWQTFGALLILGLLGVSVAHSLFFYLIQAWGATRTTLVTYMIPVVGLLLGVLVLDEPYDWRLIAGFGLVLSGIALVNRRRRTSVVEKAYESGD